MNTTFKGVLALTGIVAATTAAGQVTFYEAEGFRGRSFVTDRQIGNLERFGFNDRASSAIVERGRWEVCEDARFGGNCTVLRRGQYPSLRDMGLNNRVSSIRPVGGDRRARADAPPPPPVARAYEYYPRHNEQLFTADVVAVRAVVGPPQQRCWVEREQVLRGDSGPPNVPGAIIGGVIGGILGHQIGSGRGNDVATAIGAIGGAAVGANTGGGGQVYAQDVQRCASVGGPVRPEYWDVTYVFRGREHRVQMSTPPGRSITVNRNGEPRM